MEIVEYDEKYKEEFRRLNIAWVKRFFVMEEGDYEVIDHIEEWLDKGSMIFFAVESSKVYATCMALPLENGVWEICKLAANGQYTGTGAGSAVFKASMDYAIEQGAKKIMLISNTRLKPALHIYRKFGFQEVPLNKEYWGYDRADIQFEYIVNS